MGNLISWAIIMKKKEKIEFALKKLAFTAPFLINQKLNLLS